MILQELIRNVILYREVVKPMFFSWKDTVTATYLRETAGKPSSKLIFSLQSIKAGGDGEELGWDISDEYEEMSLSRASGTRTITDKHIIPQRVSEPDVFSQTALVSKEISIMLRKPKTVEKAVEIGKTNSSMYSSPTSMFILGMQRITGTTTGFESKQIKSFLRVETHEKREYLGEFSLTHEEIPLLYFSERGCVS